MSIAADAIARDSAHSDLRVALTQAISDYESARKQCDMFLHRREMALSRMTMLVDMIIAQDAQQ